VRADHVLQSDRAGLEASAVTGDAIASQWHGRPVQDVGAARNRRYREHEAARSGVERAHVGQRCHFPSRDPKVTATAVVSRRTLGDAVSDSRRIHGLARWHEERLSTARGAAIDHL
jgi:hypothetical protein